MVFFLGGSFLLDDCLIEKITREPLSSLNLIALCSNLPSSLSHPSTSHLPPSNFPKLPTLPYPSLPFPSPTYLLRPTPNRLQQPISLRQPIQTIIPLSRRPYEPTQRIRLRFARVAAVLVDFADRELDRGVVFGGYEPVGGAAFSGDVAI